MYAYGGIKFIVKGHIGLGIQPSYRLDAIDGDVSNSFQLDFSLTGLIY
jgi:hypothetical protein